jgi:multiple sugar transport system substrate-binding protein
VVSRGRAVATWLAITLALLGCTPSASTSPSARQGGPIRFMVFGDAEELAAYRNVVAAFGEVDPTPVTLVEAADRQDLLTRLSTSFAGGDPPDVFLINYRFYAQFAARGALEPLGPRLAASAAFGARDMFEEALSPFQFGGVQTCLPQNVSSLVVYYNRDLFEAAGLPDPEPGWRWDEMVATAKRLTLDADGDGAPEQYGLGVEPILIRLAPFIWSAGAEIVDHPTRPTRLTLESADAQRVMTSFFDLRLRHGVIPSDVERESEDDESRFLNGRTAMYLDSRRATPTFRTITDFDWDVAPLPVFREPAGILHSDAYCMAAASKHKDAGWRFVEFALGPDGQRIAAATGRIVPSLRAVATSDAFLDPDARPRNSQVWLDVVPSLRAVPAISTWPEIEDATSPLLEAAMYGELPAADLAAQLDAATRDAFSRDEAGT